MIMNTPPDQQIDQSDACFDDLMANLFVLVTHHSLTRCAASLPIIVERLNTLCSHSDIEHYPNQHKVLSKMQRLWSIELFKLQVNHKVH